jgi:preprotein translocase subunit SecA
MLAALGKRLFGSVNDRIVKSLYKYVDAINEHEPRMATLSDHELQAYTGILKDKLSKGKSIDDFDIIAESYAVVREAGKRVLGMRHFDVQLLGGVAMHKGMIAEMRTGEGKTLVATLPTYLNALTGRGVHVITVNDYLVRRDAAWMSKIYNFLGLSIGCIVHGMSDEERYNAYHCDITYGTNNEFGFDYLRDNMKFSIRQFVQKKPNFAIIDEVDSILIDEARTPLIISGPTEDNSNLYTQVDVLVRKLGAGDFEKDEKTRTVVLTDEGTNKIEQLLAEAHLLNEGGNLYDISNISLVHHVNQALKAHELFKLDVDYMVKDDKVMIIDEFTGRVMEGRRYSEGLHQALEAKEKVTIQNENQTLASITFQNYFRLYPKLAGMTGTAMTEAAEFRDIYKLEVLEIPTNLPVKRIDEDDEIYRTTREKYEAIVKEIEARHLLGQPILVGTVSIEKSEYISSLLNKKKIPHKVLNAKYHEQEAYIISQAGRAKSVTIATNMAGRGTDIKLGGNPEMLLEEMRLDSLDEAKYNEKKILVEQQVEEDKKKVLEAGGLFVIGTERHESRRIDNQLRGRAARQGDPGRTKFFLSLEDDLMRIFASERISSILQKLGMKEGEAIFHPMISKALERAQQKVESFNYEIRKNLLKYDDVMNEQRKIIYEQRIEIMNADDISITLKNMYTQLIEELVAFHIPKKSYYEEWDISGLEKEVLFISGLTLPIAAWANEEGVSDTEITNRIIAAFDEHFAAREQLYGAELFDSAKKRFLLICLDQLWKDHLHALDHLRQGINLRAYGQKDPLNEYKKEAFLMFEAIFDSLRRFFVERMAHLEINVHNARPQMLEDNFRLNQEMHESRQDPALEHASNSHVTLGKRHVAKELRDSNDPTSWGKIARNEPCPCGSGKKYKNCHGVLV